VDLFDYGKWFGEFFRLHKRIPPHSTPSMMIPFAIAVSIRLSFSGLN